MLTSVIRLVSVHLYCSGITALKGVRHSSLKFFSHIYKAIYIRSLSIQSTVTINHKMQIANYPKTEYDKTILDWWINTHQITTRILKSLNAYTVYRSTYLSVSAGNMVGLARANRICGIFSKFPTKILSFDSTRPTLEKREFDTHHNKLSITFTTHQNDLRNTNTQAHVKHKWVDM